MAADDTSGPLQLGAFLIGALAIVFIVVNAAFMQSRPHPAPIFQTRTEGVVHSADTVTKSTDRVRTKPGLNGQTDRIQTVQGRLQKLGYDVGQVDGIFGDRTRSAIVAFERDSGYPESGDVTPLLMKRLNRATPPTAIPRPSDSPQSHIKSPGEPLNRQANQRSSSGKTADRDEILLVQRALSDLGYGPIEIDGILGGETARAIQRFELDRGMSITGAIGDRIIAELVLIGGVKPIANR